MTRLIGAELLKLRTTRTFWGQVGITLGLVVVVTVLTLALTDDYFSEDEARSLLSTGFASGLLMLVLGVVFGAGEWRHGTIAWTLLVTPDRLRSATAQTIALTIAGLAVGLLIAGVTAAIGLPWLAAKGYERFSGGELAELFLGGALYSALAAAFGAAVGALLRNQVAGIVTVLVLLLVVDPAATALVDGYAKFSLQGLGVAMTGGDGDDIGAGELLPFVAAVLVWASYTAALVVAAAAVTSRRDV